MRAKYLLIWAPILIGLFYMASHNYLLFHSLAEVFAIIIACGIFIVAWNIRDLLESHYLLFLGIAYLFVGAVDLIHMLAYKGMGVFLSHGANLPTQLWIAARFIESISLLIAPFFLKRKVRVDYVVVCYSAVFALLMSSIFIVPVFPVCYVEGVGLTTFKKVCEYVISFILAAAIVLLVKNREAFGEDMLKLLIVAIGLTIGAELAFTFYVSVYGISNFVGHMLKIVSFYLIYKAIIDTGLKHPYELLFRELKQSEESLRKASVTDDLTGVFNRRGFLRIANMQLKMVERVDGALYLIYVDLDNLKWINDNLGHINGDKALIDAAYILRSTFRQSDIIGRIGGDEFAILTSGADGINNELAIMQRLDDNIKANNELEGNQHKISLSSGIVRYDPKRSTTVEELMAKADELMYINKKAKHANGLEAKKL